MNVSYVMFDGAEQEARFSTPDAEALYRSYSHSTTLELRDGAAKEENYQELAGYPTVRSGNLAFDALFALAMEEMRRNSVQQIQAWDYHANKAIDCDCFETGEKWTYVWTRDLSYAADLSLAMTDPQRVMNAMLFKLSPYRQGVNKPKQVPGSADGLQVVQDTGSGGSWPVSTDRMSWSFAARSLLPNLSPELRAQFIARAYPGLVNTIEIDRVAAFDKNDGLYTGEQSFLDWREQSYALWMATDLASLATSKSLSTNAGHYNALMLAAELAKEAKDLQRSAKYSRWALALKERVKERFWLEEQQQYASLIASHFDNAPLKKYDWLGLSLAVLSGLVEGERAKLAIAHYPHGPMGAPVIFPMQPGVAIYHNRAIWPFVTAYGLTAAKAVKNAEVADAAYQTLIRSSALNLSNMENYEWLSNQAQLSDPKQAELNGPVINSKRQLWSVAGYINAVVKNLFGVTLEGETLTFAPFVTAGLRSREFAQQEALALNHLKVQGKTLNVNLHLPAVASAKGYYPLRRVVINGKPGSAQLKLKALAADNQIDLYLGDAVDNGQAITRVSGSPYAVDDPQLFAPHTPEIQGISNTSNSAELLIKDEKNKGELSYNIFRDGALIGSTKEKNFPLTGTRLLPNACYSVEAVYTLSGNHSHHSKPYCLGQADPIYIQATALTKQKLPFKAIETWGGAGQKPEKVQFSVSQAGRYALQFHYKNLHHQTNLGITNGVKWVSVWNREGKLVAQGVVQAPHTPRGGEQAEPGLASSANRPYRLSTPLKLDLEQGEYEIQVEDFLNMSYLKSNETYNGSGGLDGAVNSIELRGIRIMPIHTF